jgi:hypothetical protein
MREGDNLNGDKAKKMQRTVNRFAWCRIAQQNPETILHSPEVLAFKWHENMMRFWADETVAEAGFP